MATKAKLVVVVPCTKTGAVCLYLFHAMLALFLLFYRCERVEKKHSLCIFFAFKKYAPFFHFVACSRLEYFFCSRGFKIVDLQ